MKESITMIAPEDLNITVVTEADGDINVTATADVEVLTPLTGIFVPGQVIKLTSSTIMSTD